MYKSKVQEICQKRSWSLPKYSTTKHGLDHNPSFSATVVLLDGDMSFHTTTLFKSSKDAQNDAARLALDHLSQTSPLIIQMPSVPSSSSLPQPSIASSSSDYAHATMESPPHQNGIAPLLRENRKFRDVRHLYKLELQIYAQKRNIVIPVYSCEREGPPHASRFKCSVAIDGKTYECREYFPTLKEAEHAAAKLALTSLSPEGLQNDDSLIYKNLLQEIAQKEGVHLPIYNTQTFGEAHNPVFVSSVEVKGQNFFGQESKTKKQAEISAARVAYNALKECDSNSIYNSPVLPPPVSPSSQQVQEPAELFPSTTMQQRVGLGIPTVSNTTKTSVSTGNVELGTTVISRGETFPHVSSSPITTGSSSMDHSNGDSNLNESASSTKINLSSTAESSLDEPSASTKTKIKLVYKKICVYPTDKPIPGGSTLLPIRDRNWVAFCPSEPTC